ncbi:MAG: hypothetical protein E6Q32_08835 [Neisseriales bacterium]|nr:MAG: hypothetical protein E6Q32_08835 [Neisseriales bacterium]
MEGNYIRSFVPELKLLPDKYLFSPWEVSENVLSTANVVLGTSLSTTFG